MPWDYTKKEYAKQAKADPRWALERVVLYGEGKKKISKKLVAKHLPDLRIPDNYRAFLELAIWGKRF